MPILGILEKRDFVNVLVVVTRYFGGILLGTGGLVKAYSDATKIAIENAKETEKEEGYVLETTLGYEEVKNFEYVCMQNKIKIIDKRYTENVIITIEISKRKYEDSIFQDMLVKKIKEGYIDKNE